MKRIASLFCTVLILLSICTIPASAHEECSFSKNHVCRFAENRYDRKRIRRDYRQL